MHVRRMSGGSGGSDAALTMCTLVLQVGLMPSPLQEELKAFHRWCTVKFYGQQHEPIADVTAQKYLDHIRCDACAFAYTLNQNQESTKVLNRVRTTAKSRKPLV